MSLHTKYTDQSLFLVVVLLVSVVHSMHWIVPYFSIDHSQFSLAPTVYDGEIGGDQYFYYAYIRNIIDGRWFTSETMLLDGGNGTTPHVSYYFSFVLGAMASLFTDETLSVYAFNYLLFPSLTFILLFRFFKLEIDNSAVATLYGLITLFFGMWFYPYKGMVFFQENILESTENVYNLLSLTQIMRTPNTLITNIHVIAFLIALFRYMGGFRLGTVVPIVLLTGISTLISPQNTIFCYTALGIGSLMHLRLGVKLKWVSLIMATSLLVALPSLFILYKGYVAFIDSFKYAITPGLTGIDGLTSPKFLSFMKYPAAVLIITFLSKPDQSKKIITVMISVVIGAVFLVLSKGEFYSWRFLFRGIEMVFGAVSLLAMHMIAQKIWIWLSSGALHKLLPSSKALSSLALLVSFVLLGVYVINQYAYASQHPIKTVPVETYELVEWSKTEAGDEKVAVTLDIYTLTNLPALSPLYHYLPLAMLSSADYSERKSRLFDVFAFYGFSPDEVDDVLKAIGVQTDTQNDSAFDNSFYEKADWVRFLLFYQLYEDQPLPASLRKEVIGDYEVHLKHYTGLKWQADYFVVSDFDRSWIHKGSDAAKLLSDTPVFSNSVYTLYSIK